MVKIIFLIGAVLLLALHIAIAVRVEKQDETRRDMKDD